jgi:aspartyl-tRNA(Asn)/glutamyl-tRNA(Gln) amidotransferase subunit A
MLNSSLQELASGLAQKKFSSVELTKAFLSRIEALNGKLNAFITLDAGKSLAQARAADERIARGKAQPLTGIPIAHKDIFVARDWLTTCGSKILSNFVSPYDAHLIERFNEAGAVLLGKTNMDEFAMGSSSESSFYGPVRNPRIASPAGLRAARPLRSRRAWRRRRRGPTPAGRSASRRHYRVCVVSSRPMVSCRATG